MVRAGGGFELPTDNVSVHCQAHKFIYDKNLSACLRQNEDFEWLASLLTSGHYLRLTHFWCEHCLLTQHLKFFVDK